VVVAIKALIEMLCKPQQQQGHYFAGRFTHLSLATVAKKSVFLSNHCSTARYL